jgi:ribonuclease HI
LGAALAARMTDVFRGDGNAESAETTNGDHQANAADLIRGLPYNTILAFSDGSSKGNPGPAGAGAVVCLPPPSYADHDERDAGEREEGGGGGGVPRDDADYRHARTRMSRLAAAAVGDRQCGTWIEGHASLGRHTANVAELEAIRLCNDIAAQARELLDYYKHCPIHIVTDSQVAQGVATGTMRAHKNKELVALTGGALADSNATVHWCKGHAGIPGNERADRLADEGAARSRGNAPPSRTIRSIAAPSSSAVATAPRSR